MLRNIPENERVKIEFPVYIGENLGTITDEKAYVEIITHNEKGNLWKPEKKRPEKPEKFTPTPTPAPLFSGFHNFPMKNTIVKSSTNNL